jgi:type IV pilus assembly protein PilM
MANTSGVWGIDLGQCALKAVRLEMIDDQLTATHFDYVEHPKILSQPDADPDQLTREALEKFLSRNDLKGDLVAISVPGQSGLARFVKLPPVEEKKIGDIVKFEAKQQIPFNLDEVVWDYQKLGSGTVTDGFALDTEIGLFAIKRDMVNRYLQHFKDVNVEVHLVQMAPLALCNFVAFDLLKKFNTPTENDETTAHGKKKSCVVALDLGTDSSNLVITDGERIIWQRPIPLGGNHFTRALTKDLKLTFAKAEHLKRNATKSVDKNIDLKKILGSLKPVLNDFVGEVQRSLGYFTNTHRDAQVEYMIGLGNAFRLPGLQKFLSEKLGLNVKKLNKMTQLAGEPLTQPLFSDNILSFAVAYGLAIQGLKLGKLQTNLLPHEIRVERLIRAKKPWAVAAAAALLLGTAACAISYAWEDKPYNDERLTNAITASEAVSKTASTQLSSFKNAQASAAAEETAVKSVIAGQEERLNWLALNRFITDCLPRPDPTVPLNPITNRPDTDRNNANLRADWWEKYANPMRQESGKLINENVVQAFNQFNTWRNRTTTNINSVTTNTSDLWMKDLILINIESIDSRYSENLGDVWTNIKSAPRFKEDVSYTVRGKPVKDAVEGAQPTEGPPAEITPPEGAGWVIELRGSTYHRDKKPFIVNTLVENLGRFGTAKYKLKDRSLTGLRAEKVPEAILTKLQIVKDEPYPSKKDFLDRVKKVLGNSDTDRYQALLLTHSEIKLAEEPVLGRGSHALIVKSRTLAQNDQSILGVSVLDSVLAAPAQGGGNVEGGGTVPAQPGAAQPGPAQPAAGGRSGWTGLTGVPAGNNNGGVGINNNFVTDSTPKSALERTEFVVLFFWKEHTPSDSLMKAGESAGGSEFPAP